MKIVVGYKCKHCGLEESRHRSTDKACIIGNKRIKFPQFSEVQSFEKDERKPVRTKFVL
jgi:hypothetical protein